MHTKKPNIIGCGRVGSNHGFSKEPLYLTYKNMLTRCYRESDKAFHLYGGRGIGVCDRWLNSYPNFKSDMGERPLGMSLDRIDPNKDYSPENCRWANALTQSRNRDSVIKIEYLGESLFLSELAVRTGISRYVLYARLIKYKWPIERAISIPVVNRPKIERR